MATIHAPVPLRPQRGIECTHQDSQKPRLHAGYCNLFLKLVQLAADAHRACPDGVGPVVHGTHPGKTGHSGGAGAPSETTVTEDRLSLRIAHNVDAVQVQRHLNASNDRIAVAMKRLSSGLRINSAADDAAGLGISEQLRGQIRGLEQANRNVQDGISMLNTMDAALDTVHSILQRARELAVQFNNGVLDMQQKGLIIEEFNQLSDEVARIEGMTMFNGIPLLQNANSLITLQVGANDGETITVSLVDLFGGGLALVRPNTFNALPWLDADIQGFDLHINDVALARTRIGAITNRLEYTLASNQNRQENYMSAESRIRDVDMAAEMITLTRQQVLQASAGTALLFAQQSPSRILDLLK
ncbi:MAG: flagellin FliC [Thermoleophilia bacterium]|nr:flagellin FliC [Thermoleophilia bacterium]